MPLIMLCGGPLSGKTLLTKKLELKCKELYPDREVQILSHEILNISRLVFKDMPTEKKFNQKLISLVEQALTTRRVLIVDFICLTKSLRYQLYGKANFTGTVSCVVHCTTPYEITLERNKQENYPNIDPKQFYTPEIFEDLWNRLEIPLDTCKWDYPCYSIDCTNIQSFLPIDSTTTTSNSTQQIDPNDKLYEQILHSICDNSKKNLSRANLPTRNESSGFVTILDKITTSIVDQIINQQQIQGFVVGALLETHSIDIEIDISEFLQNNNNTLNIELPTTPTDSTITSPTDPTTPATTTTLSTELNQLTLDPTTTPLATTPSPTAPVSATTVTPTSGLKIIRKTRGVKSPTPSTTTTPNDTSNPSTLSPTTPSQLEKRSKYTLTIKNPATPSKLFELKQSFTRVATMMNVKSADQMAKAFVEYLTPQLNPL